MRVHMPVSHASIEMGQDESHLELAWSDGFVQSAEEIEWQPLIELSKERWRCQGRSDDVEVIIMLESEPFSSLLQWRVQVINHRSTPLDSVRIELVAPKALPESWTCTLPWCGGWAIRLSDFAAGDEVNLRYPVLGSLQWIELFGPDEGLTFSTRDGVPWLKDFKVARTATGVTIGLFHRNLGLEPGTSVDLPAIALGAHRGDWQVAAAAYAHWLSTVVPKPSRAPQWLQENPAWAWVSGKPQNGERPETRYRDLPDRSNLFAAVGIPTIQYSAWLEHGHDTRYPDYVAGESFGGEHALKAAAKEIHAAGRRIALYTNGRLLDPLSQTAQEHPDWPSWAVTAPNGQNFKDTIAREYMGIKVDMPLPDWDQTDRMGKEQYGDVVFATMCPSSKAWQDVFAARLAYAAEAYEIDGVYIDQILGASAVPCFSDRHDHAHPYESWRGYHDLMSNVRQQVKAKRPEAYLATEGFSDILGQYFDLVQSHNDWPGPCPKGSFPFPEMTRHAVPWLMQAAGPVREGESRMVRLAHVAGSGLDLAVRTVTPSSEFADELRQFCDWRKRFGPEMYGSAPISARVSQFPDRRVMALINKESLICCIAALEDTSNTDDFEVSINLAPDRIEGREVEWESMTAKGRATLWTDANGWGGFRVPFGGMVMVWGRIAA